MHLGESKVMTTVNADLGEPKHGRDNQGSVSFKVGFDSSLLPHNTLLGGAKNQSVMLTRWLERLFLVGNALDREALCIVAGKLVSHLSLA